MAKIIFTADDYGCNDQIDSGILEAIDEGLVNSVAVFANGPNRKDRFSKLLEVIKDKKVDVGCHLTITSGKPITAEGKIFTKDGIFRSFVNLKRKGTFNAAKREEVKRCLKVELQGQIDVLKNAGLIVKHLSCHHNTLYFFPEYLESLIEVASENTYKSETGELFKVRMRSLIVQPKIRNDLYLTQIQARSIFSLDPIDTDEIETFNENLRYWLEKKKDLPFRPDFADGRHYGPIPFIFVRNKMYERKAKKKCKSLLKSINLLSDDVVIEYMFHLATDKLRDKGVRNYIKNFDKKAYPGVNHKYFDGRVIELMSLKWMKSNFSINSLISWDHI
ncbi:MAG: ChbG/HpnK family deacetylase [Reichenbachiella sp.]